MYYVSLYFFIESQSTLRERRALNDADRGPEVNTIYTFLHKPSLIMFQQQTLSIC